MKSCLAALLLLPVAALSLATGCTKGNDAPLNNPGQPNGPTTEAPKTDSPPFTQFASFAGVQVTGVTVSESGRTFANFPRWRDGLPFSVVEVAADGSYQPYPNAQWNTWNGQAAHTDQFVCVQSVVAHGNSLFVLDPSNPLMKGVVGLPTLYEFDLATNAVVRQWTFDEKVAPSRSYLNDLRFDDDGRHVYITESGVGAILVLDMQTGKTRRLLEKRPSTKSEIVTLMIDGKPIVKPNGLPQRFNADGIAINGGYLYYHSVTAYHLYRIAVDVLKDESLDEAAVAAKVEDLGLTPAPDGMIFDKAGNLYMADLEKHAIVYRRPSGEIVTLVQDSNIHWADTFSLDTKGNLIFTDSYLNEVGVTKPAAGFNFTINRVPLAAQ